MSTPIPWGTEFLVNTTTAYSQSDPTITALANGRFVVAWTDFSNEATGPNIRAQVFNADSTKSGAELLVNTATAYSQTEPTITALADGGFVIAYTHDSPVSLTGSDIRAQVFSASGSKVGTEFLVNPTGSDDENQPAITTLSDGRFLVAWTKEDSTLEVWGNFCFPDGTSDHYLWSLPTLDGNKSRPAVAALENGGFAIAWVDDSGAGGDASMTSIRATLVDAADWPGPIFQVNTTTTGEQSRPTVTALADGRFVVAWEDFSATGDDASEGAVRAQVFNSDGSRFGTEFVVNTITSNSQTQPNLTALPDGRFVAVWVDSSFSPDDLYGFALRAQVFATDGSTSGNEFLVNLTTAGYQYQPVVTALADGRFVVAWTDDSQTGADTGGTAVRARIFDPRDAAVALRGSALGDDFVGTSWGDTLRGGWGDDTLAGAAGDDDLFGDSGTDVIRGGTGNDLLQGGDEVYGGDQLYGGSGGDELYGGGGDDTLVGDAGADVLSGGAGNDVYGVDSLADVIVPERTADGTDTVRSTITYVLHNIGVVENLTLLGSASINGTGNSLANKLTGNGAANVLLGTDGNDTLAGAYGNDALNGGLGRDVFRFDTAPNSSTNKDTITGFSVVDDTIQLENAVYAALTAMGTLAAADFISLASGGASVIVGTGVNVIYDRGTGNLFYDPSGGNATGRVLFATLAGSPDTVTNADFQVT